MAKIELYSPKLWKIEGGYVNDSDDSGGATNHGITIATFRGFFPKATIQDLKDVSYSQYQAILRKLYWNRWKADLINNQSIAEMLVDWTYNSGNYGITIPQRILKVDVDGIVGNDTITAVNNANQEQLFTSLKSERKNFYDRIVHNNPTQKKFYNGWMVRINEFTFKA